MRPVVLTILDGWGFSKQRLGNAILTAQTPTINEIAANYPSMLLQASGMGIGMTFGESGNSEVGHLTLGAGRIIFQYLTRINKAIETDDFFTNSVLVDAAKHVKENGSILHIVGLLTSGAVHAHFIHLKALIEFAQKNELPFRLHLFMDGRDSGLKEGAATLRRLSDEVDGLSNLGSIVGRDFAMDRNHNWDRTEIAYKLLVNAVGNASDDVFKALEGYYNQGMTDANIPPTVVNPSPVNNGDALVFFNFREDSMRQLLRVFVENGFDLFLKKVPENLYIATMTEYIESPALHVLFPPPAIKNCLAEVLADNGKKQLHIAETEKYAHVTLFFNGLHNKPFSGEVDIFMESLEKPLENPQMRASDIARKVAEEMDRDLYDFFVLNLANGDILAHLGVLNPAVIGVQAIDTALEILKEKILEKDGIMIITADHGNAESMIYRGTGEKETKHDDNPVPLYLIGREYQKPRSEEEVDRDMKQANGLLADVAPTVLALMGIEKPVEMTGESLLPALGLL